MARVIDREVAPVWHDRFARMIYREMPLNPRTFVLDVHCGPGRSTAELLQRLDAGRYAGTSHTGKTGVEMEALTAASTAALTVYDMCKAVQRDMVISDVRLVMKDGGKSGRFEAR